MADPQAIQFDDPRRIEYVTRDCFSVYEQIDENFAIIRDAPAGAIIGASITRPREQEGAAAVAWRKRFFEDHPWIYSDTDPNSLGLTSAVLIEPLYNQRFLRDLVDIAVSWAYECPNYMARKHADQLIAMVIAGKKPEYAAVARLDGFPSAPIPAASFQAGAEAMREAAAKHLRPTNPRPCDCEPYRCYCQNYDDAQRIAAWDADNAAADAILALELPIPASSEGR